MLTNEERQAARQVCRVLCRIAYLSGTGVAFGIVALVLLWMHRTVLTTALFTLDMLVLGFIAGHLLWTERIIRTMVESFEEVNDNGGQASPL